MNILVTGANGQLGNEMRIISKDANDIYTFTDVVEVEGVETTILDITDAEAIRKIVKEKDIRCIVNSAPHIQTLIRQRVMKRYAGSSTPMHRSYWQRL